MGELIRAIFKRRRDKRVFRELAKGPENMTKALLNFGPMKGWE